MRQDIFVFRYWGWWVVVALVRLALLPIADALTIEGDVHADSLWRLLPEGRLPDLFPEFCPSLVFLDTLLVGYGVSVALSLWQRNRVPNTEPEPPAV